jgi:NACHT domain
VSSSSLIASWFDSGVWQEHSLVRDFRTVHAQEFILLTSSSIIENVKDTCKDRLGSMCFFYFDFKDTLKRDVRGFVSSLLVQLSDQSPHFCDILYQLYTKHRDGAEQPSEEKLIQCLKAMLGADGQPPIYIIVDAVDECPNTPRTSSPRKKVLNLLEDLVKSHFPSVHILVTSRPEHDIRSVLGSLSPDHTSLHDQSGQKDDIINYVNFVVHSYEETRRWRSEDKDLVIRRLSEGANGM